MSGAFTIPQNQPPSHPDLADALSLLRKDIFLNMNCHHLGTIQSFDASKQTASATINYKKTFFELNKATGIYNAVLIDYPILIDCPVICLGGGTTGLTFPIQSGDECLIIFNDRDIDNWFSGAGNGAVATPRLHSLADGIILVGPRSKANVIQNYDTERATLFNGTTVVGVGESLVKIANNQFTLNTLLQELISELQDLVNQTSILTVTGVTSGSSPSGPPQNAAAIVLIGTQIMVTANKIAELLE